MNHLQTIPMGDDPPGICREAFSNRSRSVAPVPLDAVAAEAINLLERLTHLETIRIPATGGTDEAPRDRVPARLLHHRPYRQGIRQVDIRQSWRQSWMRWSVLGCTRLQRSCGSHSNEMETAKDLLRQWRQYFSLAAVAMEYRKTLRQGNGVGLRFALLTEILRYTKVLTSACVGAVAWHLLARP